MSLMGKERRIKQMRGSLPKSGLPRQPQKVPSLLDRMEDGNEYGSIVGLVPDTNGHDLVPELRRALAAIEIIRGRPCICYVANIVKDVPDTAIVAADHLPFAEMVGRVDLAATDVDVFLATPGGSAEQVIQFVEALRKRFKSVEFLIPYKAMSAGTLWALSGDRIWMDERAFLGPIDPQVLSKDGRYVPAQALLSLLSRIQKDGQAALQQGQQPPWSDVVLLRELDPRQIGAALSASQYSITMARSYLKDYKFKGWVKHKDGRPVTAAERESRAHNVGEQLCSHDRWKAHGHTISRDVLWQELKVLIEHPASDLERAMRRMWALLVYTFDRTSTSKILLSQRYAFVRSTPIPGPTGR